MKTPFIKKFFNGIFGTKAENKKVAAQATNTVAAPAEKKSALQHFIPTKEYHKPPIMETSLASIRRHKRNVRNRIQKHSRKVNFGLA